MSQNVGEFVAAQNGNPPQQFTITPKPRAGSWQSRRKMITLYTALAFTTIGTFGGCASHSSAATPPPAPPAAVQQAPAVVAPVAPAPAPAPAEVKPAPAPVESGPVTTFSDGTYIVGEDIMPGTYRSDGTSGYWARLSNTEGGINGIIANDNIHGPSVVTIKKTDKAFETSGGITWTLKK